MAMPESFETRQQELIEWCKDQIAWYGLMSSTLGRRLRQYRALVLFFSVSVTVISGIPILKDRFPWSITVAAGLSTFFAGLLTISKTEEAFANHSLTSGQLRRELLLYRQEAGIYEGLEREKQLLVLAERVATIDERNAAQAVKQIGSGGKSE